MIKKVVPIIAIAALLLILLSPAPVVRADETIGAALSWVRAQQRADGGFSNGFSPESDMSTTAEAVIALASGDQDAGTVRSSDGASPLDFMYRQVQTGQLEGTGITAKVVSALVAAGLDPSDFAGRDLVARLEAAYDSDSGSYGGSVFDQALVMLALANAGRAVPQGAADYLLAYQTTDGAWSFTGDTAALSGDTNTTALVIQALAAAGRKDDAGRALAYLQRVQNDDAGWPYQNPSPYGTETDANSTALVIQAIHAVGQRLGDWYVEGSDPLGALLSLQNDSGSFSFQASFPGDNMLATVQAVPAAAGITLAAVSRVPTGAAPGAEAAGPPSTLPEAGGGVLPTAIGILGIGWLLVVTGQWLKGKNRRTAL